MKLPLLCAIMLLVITLHARSAYCDLDSQFTRDPYFALADIASDNDVNYANVTDWQGQSQMLDLNVFYPDPAIDTATKRPLIVLLHGGGFVNGNRFGLDETCQEFARRGFVAATITYRLGWDTGTGCNGDTVSQMLAVYRAVQDLHASLRYLSANASVYNIDTNWVFVGGNSAGAFTALFLSYYSQAEVDIVHPFLGQTLGNVDTVGNSFTNTFKIKGVFDNWGSVTDLSVIGVDDSVPMIGFHGEDDLVAPIDSGYNFNCTEMVFLYGSRSIYKRLQQQGICAELTIKSGAGHGIYKTTYQQNVFRVGRASCFFKSVMCNTCSSQLLMDSIPADCYFLDPVNGIIDNTPELYVSIYPNPANKLLSIVTDKPIDRVKVFDIYGRQLMLATHVDQIDIEELPSGMYLIELDSGGRTTLERFLKY